MDSITRLIGYASLVSGIFLSLWMTIKYIIALEMKIPTSQIYNFYTLASNSKHNWEISKEFIHDGTKHPHTYNGLFYIHSMWIWMSIEERLLNAGFKGVDVICKIKLLRWNRKKLEKLLSGLMSSDENKANIPVFYMDPYSDFLIGRIKSDIDENYFDTTIRDQVNFEIDRVLSGEKNRVGFLLHGTPGNGKTSLVKYIAMKYNMPIHLFGVAPDYTNQTIVSMFTNLKKCIVLFEDFDGVFNGRDYRDQNAEVSFTFDSILNVLDGVYNDYDKVIFFMTVNHLDVVDESIKERPSRFKHVMELREPNKSVCPIQIAYFVAPGENSAVDNG